MSFLAFLAAAIVLAVTPGPGIAYVVARTVAGGRAEGLASCFGTAIGGVLHVVAAATGLSLLVAQSAAAFTVVKVVGAVYLVYLGVRLLLQKDRATPTVAKASGARPPPCLPPTGPGRYLKTYLSLPAWSAPAHPPPPICGGNHRRPEPDPR